MSLKLYALRARAKYPHLSYVPSKPAQQSYWGKFLLVKAASKEKAK